MSATNQPYMALLQSVLQVSQHGVLVYKGIRRPDGAVTDLQLIMLNAVAEQALGRPASAVLGQSFEQVHPHLTGTGLAERFCEVIRTGQADRFEFKTDQPDALMAGWCDVSAVRLDHESVAVSYVDIAEAKAEAVTSRFSQLLQASFDASINGITIFDAIYDEEGTITDFRFAMVNNMGVQLSGYTRKQLVGRTLWEIYPATKINGLFDDYVQVCQTGQPISKEHYYPEYDTWREVKIVRIPTGVMVTYNDITASKKMQEAALQQNQLLGRVLECLPVGIAVLDIVHNGDSNNRTPCFRFVRINSLLETILGQAATEVVGKNLTDVFVDANVSGLLSRCITGIEGGVVQEFELPFTLGKQAGWYRISMAPQDEQLILAVTDVTAIKRAQLAHHRQIELLNSVLNGSQSSIVALEAVRDTTGRVVDFQYVLQNEFHHRLTGRSDYQLLGHRMLDVVPEFKAHNLIDRLAEVVVTGLPLRTEIGFNFGTGPGWYDLSAVKREDGIVLTIQDKTAHKVAEQKIHDQAHLLKSISDSTPAGLVLWEAVRDETPQRNVIDFRYRMTNLMNAYVTGYSADKLIGRDLLALFPRFRGTELEMALRETITTGRTQRMIFTYYKEAADGWFDAQFIRIGEGQPTDKVLMTYMDVTETYQTQLLQKQQADLMKLVIDAQPAGIVLYEPVRETGAQGQPGPIVDFTFKLVNETERRLTGRSNNDLIGRRMKEVFPSEAAQELFAELVEVAETGQPKEWLLPYFSDGIRGWFQSSLICHDNQVLFTFLDVTDLKRQQQALEMTNHELRRSNQNLQEFAYIASHDLQEPLRKVQSFGDILSTSYGHVLDQRGLDMIGQMNEAAHRMSELIRHLLVYSRLSTQLIKIKPVSLSSLLSVVLDDLSVAIQESNATIHWDDLPVIFGDEEQLRQLFQNLVSNAVKYRQATEAPIVKISSRKIAAAQVPLSSGLLPVTTTESGRLPMYYEICVSDNGIGFDEKYLDRIFLVFQRLHKKGTYAGTGIGLAICQKVVENHQGALTAVSKPGEGATFKVYLPIAGA